MTMQYRHAIALQVVNFDAQLHIKATTVTNIHAAQLHGFALHFSHTYEYLLKLQILVWWWLNQTSTVELENKKKIMMKQ